MTNDLDAILLLVLGTVAGLAGLLFLLAALEPETQREARPLPAPEPAPDLAVADRAA